ncbi:hypothetical protein WAF17_18970 [Bernardetia sp. ABR2-2B]|uniref:hypothetical protein n=1 Tax=Bernardetia sp. ABR2-2B TaxID=3127472 RepID=UPI0030D391A3
MKKIICTLFLINLFISSCISEQNTSQDEVINTPYAIFIMPTQKVIDSLQKADEKAYSIVLDDNMYYLGLTRGYLDSLQIPVLDTIAEGNLKFQNSKNEAFELDLSQNAWQVILFNGTDEPIKINVTDSEIEIKKYMK